MVQGIRARIKRYRDVGFRSGNEIHRHSLLLEDLKFLFERELCEERGYGLSSTEIAHALAEMEDRPWPEFARGKPITQRGIATLLKPWNIFPKQVKVRGGKWGPNGYEPKQFKGAFGRYLPEQASEGLKAIKDQGDTGKKRP